MIVTVHACVCGIGVVSSQWKMSHAVEDLFLCFINENDDWHPMNFIWGETGLWETSLLVSQLLYHTMNIRLSEVTLRTKSIQKILLLSLSWNQRQKADIGIGYVLNTLFPCKEKHLLL